MFSTTRIGGEDMTELTQERERDLTVAEVAREFRTNKHSVYAAINSGMLRAYRIAPKSTRVTRAAVEEFKANGGLLCAIYGDEEGDYA